MGQLLRSSTPYRSRAQVDIHRTRRTFLDVPDPPAMWRPLPLSSVRVHWQAGEAAAASDLGRH